MLAEDDNNNNNNRNKPFETGFNGSVCDFIREECDEEDERSKPRMFIMDSEHIYWKAQRAAAVLVSTENTFPEMDA